MERYKIVAKCVKIGIIEVESKINKLIESTNAQGHSECHEIRDLCTLLRKQVSEILGDEDDSSY